MGFVLLVPLVIPVLLGASALLPRAHAWRRYSEVAASVAVLAGGICLIWLNTGHGAQTPSFAFGLLRADALSAYMLAVVGAVGVVATWGGLGPRPIPGRDAGAGRFDDGVYSALICAFLAAMSLAVLADNLGIMWVAVEATTIATAFLVGFHRTRRSLEAAWKYVMLGSAGVATAFLGVVLIYASTSALPSPTLSWVALAHEHLRLDPGLIRFGAALAVLGFATKAGLAPMHSWLPDAHSQAPAPVSGLMSGVLLSVALYAILRIQTIADLVLGAEFLRALLVVGGLLSLAIAAAMLLRQRDYKRMLAYSSIEHMGVMALGASIGQAALPAVLLYILSHGLIKACLFVISGRILAREGTTRISEVRTLLVRRPALAVPWLIAIVALLGFPPFGIFFAEVGIVIAGWAAGMGVVMALALVLMLVIFASLARSTVAMLFGAPDAAATRSSSAQSPSASHRDGYPPGRGQAPLVVALCAGAIIPFLAGPVGSALTAAAASLRGIN